MGGRAGRQCSYLDPCTLWAVIELSLPLEEVLSRSCGCWTFTCNGPLLDGVGMGKEEEEVFCLLFMLLDLPLRTDFM